MARVFSTNQNRQLYVAKAYNASVDDTSAVGTIGGVKVVDGVLHFLYKGADNSLKSDYIQLKNLDYAKAIAKADLVTPLKSLKVTLDANINGGNPVAGQDYILRLNLRQWIGMSELDQYFKDGAVHATASMSSAQFYQELKDSLDRSFSREIGATKTSNPYFTFSADASGLTITEKEQEWELGTHSLERVMFDVQPTTVFFSGEDVIWGEVTNITPDKASVTAGVDGIGNGKQIAELEYFCMGERGDQYRNVGWPNVVNTKYLVDASKEYNVLEIHFAFTDTGVNSYRSEKDITVVSDDASVINSLIGEINSQAGLSIATI